MAPSTRLASPRGRAWALARPQNSFSLFRYLFPKTSQRARDRLSAFRHESLPQYRHRAQARIYQLILKRQEKLRKQRAAGGSFLKRLLARRRASRLLPLDHVKQPAIADKVRQNMAQSTSDTEAAFGRGTRRKKLAGLIKSANELRQSYQQSYGLSAQHDGPSDYDDSGMPGAFPDVAIARSGDEEMLLFPSYARRHNPSKRDHLDLPGSIYDSRERETSSNASYVRNEWDRYEDANSVIEVDVRGWVYSPPRGQMSRYNRAMIALARRMSGIPAPSSSRASSPNSAHHLRVEARATKHEQEVVDRQAESIRRKGEDEQDVAWRGGYSEAPSSKAQSESHQSSPMESRTPSPARSEDLNARRPRHLSLDRAAALEDPDDAPGPGSLAKRASWNHPADMSSAELSLANSHMMLRLKPFLTTPLTSTPLTVFFYNDKTSRSRTIYTNDAGHFNLRAALDFIPTNVRVLASEKLSATEEIHITEPHGVSLISDVDDTIKHSAIGAGAREVFRNVFIRDLGDLKIDGVKEWYTKMASMGVNLHYVSNMPWQLFPVLMSFLHGAGLPAGSFHLKHYTGMLQGIFEPVAERKKGTLDRIMSDFPRRRFILVGDSGEADLELYSEIVEANPGRVLGVFIRDVTTKAPQGFFDSSVKRDNKGVNTQSPHTNGAENGDHEGRKPAGTFQERPKLPPRPKTQSYSNAVTTSEPAMGNLIDFEVYEEPAQEKRTDNGALDHRQTNSSKPNHSYPPRLPSKPSILRSPSMPYDGEPCPSAPELRSINRKPPPPRPPKPRKLSADSHLPHERSPLSQSQASPSNSSAETTNISAPSPDREGYRASVRNKVSSVYNSLPSFYSQPPSTSINTPRPLPDRSHSAVSSLSARAQPPPIPPRRTNLSSYPAAAAHYATNRFSGGWSGYNNAAADGASDMPVRNKKEELWLQRWERAKEVMKRNGVVLRSWRVGTDVLEEAVKLVETAGREEGGKGKAGRS
ncbi:MAG: hypothetical protein Q9220_001715 [cf. Caloplaca sp. 1 TL-2023]